MEDSRRLLRSVYVMNNSVPVGYICEILNNGVIEYRVFDGIDWILIGDANTGLYTTLKRAHQVIDQLDEPFEDPFYK